MKNKHPLLYEELCTYILLNHNSEFIIMLLYAYSTSFYLYIETKQHISITFNFTESKGLYFHTNIKPIVTILRNEFNTVLRQF